MFRPTKYFAFGFAPSYNRWALDLGVSSSEARASLHTFSPFVGFKPMVPVSEDVTLYFPIASGANITIAHLSIGTYNNSDSQVYWGMNFGFGVSYKKLNFTWKTAFLRDHEYEESFPWMNMSIGYIW